MSRIQTVSLLFALCLLLISFVRAVPTWEGLNGHSSMGSLVLGASYIEAMGPRRTDEIQTRHLSIDSPGRPGHLTIAQNAMEPPMFYINRNQLWQFMNETTIFPVNVINATETSDFPLQLIVGHKPKRIANGTWRWKGTMLFYDSDTTGNQGIYYGCKSKNGTSGVFMFLQPSPTPAGCEAMTLHSFTRERTK